MIDQVRQTFSAHKRLKPLRLMLLLGATLLFVALPSSAFAQRRGDAPRQAKSHSTDHRLGLRQRQDIAHNRADKRLAISSLHAIDAVVKKLEQAAQRATTTTRARELGNDAPCAGEELTPEAGNLSEVRAAVICLVNKQRTQRGERPLIVNAKLNRAAQGHTESMVNEDYFSHYDPDGETPSERIKAAGYITPDVGYEVGENIAWGTLYLATPKATVQAWMESQGHRENILNRRYRETGVGAVAEVPAAYAEGQQGAIYTQDFGVLIPAS